MDEIMKELEVYIVLLLLVKLFLLIPVADPAIGVGERAAPPRQRYYIPR